MGRLVFLVGFAVLAAFAAPGLYLRDSGELTTTTVVPWRAVSCGISCARSGHDADDRASDGRVKYQRNITA